MPQPKLPHARWPLPLTCVTPTHTQIHAECDNPLDASSGSYTTRVLLGRRADEILEVYARTLVKQPVKSAAFASCELLSTGRPATGSSVADSTAL